MGLINFRGFFVPLNFLAFMQCEESKIWVLFFQMCNLRIFGLFAAFLVFMAFKVKPKTSNEFSKPFDHVRAKKIIKNHFFLSGLWCGLQKIFFGLFHFFWDILCLRSLLGCSNPIPKYNIIPKGKWFKFPISNHSECKVQTLKFVFKLQLYDLQLTQFYGHVMLWLGLLWLRIWVNWRSSKYDLKTNGL